MRKHKRVLGDSIELRPESVELREEFGHWEVDTVLGSKYEDEPCTVTMTERKTRNSIWIKAANHTADAVQEAIQSIMDYFGIKASTVFKSVTGDNGSEFARLAELASQGTSVYFTHPYSSWEKGINECHNRLLRRFIPKGVSMAGYSIEDIAYMADWANTLPRKILGYRNRRSCLTKNWTESTPSERRLRFVLPPVGASPLPPEEQTALTKIVTCQNYCNLLLQFAI